MKLKRDDERTVRDRIVSERFETIAGTLGTGQRWTRSSFCFLHFDKPLCIGGVEYHYFDLTLVDMPGNTNGVQSFTTGYFSSKDKTVPNLPITHATSIRQLPFQISTTRVNANGNPTREPSTSEAYNVSVHVECDERAFQFQL